MPKDKRRSFQVSVAPVIVATALQVLCRHSCLESGLAAPAMQRPQFVLFGDSLTQHSFDEGTLAAPGDATNAT